MQANTVIYYRDMYYLLLMPNWTIGLDFDKQQYFEIFSSNGELIVRDFLRPGNIDDTVKALAVVIRAFSFLRFTIPFQVPELSQMLWRFLGTRSTILITPKGRAILMAVQCLSIFSGELFNISTISFG